MKTNCHLNHPIRLRLKLNNLVMARNTEAKSGGLTRPKRYTNTIQIPIFTLEKTKQDLQPGVSSFKCTSFFNNIIRNEAFFTRKQLQKKLSNK